MILVLLGTQNNSFYRLLEEIDKLISENIINEEVIAQTGYTKYETQNMKLIDFVSKEELEKLLENADLIITHGGVGSIIMSIKKGKKVIAIPRLHKYSEHVNDHQKEIVELFNKKGYIIGINEVEELKSAFSKIEEFNPIPYKENNEKMLKIIEEFIEKIE